MLELAGDFYFKMAEFDPVWGTEVGIHTCDSLFADISDEWRTDYNDFLQKELDKLNKIDTSGWPIDDRIDYVLLRSDIEYKALNIGGGYFNSVAAMTFPEKCYDGLYFLMARQSSPLSKRLPAIMSRAKKIPEFLARSEGYIDTSSRLASAYGDYEARSTEALIKSFTEVLVDSFPGNNSPISTVRDKAIFSLENYVENKRKLFKKHIEEYQVGKDRFNRILSDVYFLDFDVDSLKKIAETTFKEARELEYFYDSRASNDYPCPGGSDVYSGPTEDSAKSFYYSEIDSIRQYLLTNEIVTVPEKMVGPLLLNPDTSGIMEHAMRDFFVGPGQFDQDRRGFYYTSFHAMARPMGCDIPVEYFSKRIRGGFIMDIIPGDCLQIYMAGEHPSLIRRMQRNDMMVEGWGLYMKEYLALRGLIGDDPAILRDIYKEIKMYAIGLILDIGIHCEHLTHDSLSVIWGNLGGDTRAGYASHYREYPYPSRNLKFVLGRYLILKMRDNAKARMGAKFDIRDFHDKILSEGCIPPALIAKKYGW